MLQDHLLLVGPYSDTLALPLDTPGCQVVTECDGARIISAEQHDLLRRVPDPLVEVFSIGSTAPGGAPVNLVLPAGLSFCT